MSQNNPGATPIPIQRRVVRLFWPTLLFIAATAALLVTLRYGQLSIGYLVRAVLIGAAAAMITVAYIRWPGQGSGWGYALLMLALVLGGYHWSKDQTLGVAQGELWSWQLAVQFLSGLLVSAAAVIVVDSHRRAA